MKKIVIAMLLILPLIIVATVLLSANIISMNVYIAVESVKLNADDMITLPLSDGQHQFQATVYPTGARNHNVYFEIENYECFGDDVDNAVTIDQTGLVKFSTYCAFDVVVTSEEGYQTDRCNVIIESGKVETVKINRDSYTIATGDSQLVAPTFNPIDGQVESLTWYSDNPNVLRVDRNGIITAVSEGTANITVKVSDTIYDTKIFTVIKGVTKYGTEFSVSRNFALSEIEPNGVVTVISGGALNGDNFTFNDNVAIIRVGETDVTVSKCAADDIEFEHADIMVQKFIKLGGVPLYLNAVYSDVLNNSVPQVSYVTENELMATISENGKITAASRGEVQFVASLGSKSITINLNVIQEVKYLRLNTIDSDDKKGIADTCVYGNQIYSNGSFVPYSLELAIRYPQNADWQDFDISLNDESVAYIDGNKIVFKDNIEGIKILVITVKAKHSAYQSMEVTARRTLKVISAVNCSDYQSMYQAGLNGKSICMLNNIALESTDSVLQISGSLYGNGCMLDGMKKTLGAEEPLVEVKADNVTVSNIHIRCDDVAKINEANGMKGCALSIGTLMQAERFTNITVEFSILGDGYYGMSLHNSDVKVNGCVIRNTSNFGIFLPSNYNEMNIDKCDYSNLHMNNCVMSNIVATAIGVAANENLPSGDTLPKQSNLYSTGFLDIYNWQDVTSARMLERPIIEENEAFDTTLKKIINNTLSNEIKKDKYSSIRNTVDNVDYLHLGIVTAGAIYENTSIIEIEDERFIKFPIAVLDDLSDNALIKLFLKNGLRPCVLYIYDNTSDITVKSEFSENKWSYKRLRGEESI